MTAPRILTYADVIDHLEEFMVGQGHEASQPAIRSAIYSAYIDLANIYDWPFLHQSGRVYLYAAESTGTVVYDHTAGANERQLTLTGATWPSWAADANVQFDGLVCDIESRVSSTVVTLHARMNPGQDVASSSFTVYQRWARLPCDFKNLDGPLGESTSYFGKHVSLSELLQLDRASFSTGELRYYYVGEVPDLYGQKAIFFWPYSTANQTIDFAYTRRPRELRYSGHDANDFAGTIAVTASSATVTGTSTAFPTADGAGSILRIASSTTRPTGPFGKTPYVEERAINAVASAASLTLDAAVVTTRSGVSYQITDPIDIQPEARNAFLRMCERNLAITRGLPNLERFELAARMATIDAMAGANPIHQDYVAGDPGPYGAPRGIHSDIALTGF